MNLKERNELLSITSQLNAGLEGVDFSNTFYVVFTRQMTKRLMEEVALTEPNALRVAASIKCDVQLLIECQEDRQVIEQMVESYVRSFAATINELSNSTTGVTVDVMEKLAADMHVTFS